jgi:uncharacterized protein YegP (UPF0339 family)
MKVHRIEIFAVLHERKFGKIRREWAWHALARNGRKLGWSGESYTRRAACIAAMVAVTDAHRRGILVRVVDE